MLQTMKYTHLFFDMDNTLAPFRQLILPEMTELLNKFTADIVIVSGQSNDKIEWQSNAHPAIRMGQNGNEAADVDGTKLWYTPLTEAERNEVYTHIALLKKHFDVSENPEWNPVEDRGAQITYSPIGNTAPVEVKATFDPDRSKRLAALAHTPLVSDTLTVKIGGSTSFDYFPATRNKGTNVQRLIDLKGWNSDECVYFGDGLFPGGNDEAVIGVTDTVAVTDQNDTYERLQKLLSER